MNLVRDILDKRVVDRNGREVGRVDRIILEVRDDAAPRVAHVEIGPAALASRVRPAFGRWVTALEYAFNVGDGSPTRILIKDVLEIGDHIKIAGAVGETAAARVEQQLRAYLSRLPGSS